MNIIGFSSKLGGLRILLLFGKISFFIYYHDHSYMEAKE